MAGIKRTQNDLLAAETEPTSNPVTPRPQTSPTSKASQYVDEPITKKSKTASQPVKRNIHDHTPWESTTATPTISLEAHNLKQKQVKTHQKVLKRSQAAKNKSRAKKVTTQTTVNEDDEMSDAPFSEKDGEGETFPATSLERKKAIPRKSGGNPGDASTDADKEMSDVPSNAGEDAAASQHTMTTIRGAILPFTPLPPILARHMANHQYAPASEAAQRSYLKLVGQLQLHPSRHPMQTPNSKVSVQARHAIYERYFLGKTNEDCIETWNSYDGNVSSAQAISKVLLRDTSIWFAEENAVLPWMARKNDEKNELKRSGMGSKNFPAPHATTPPRANGARAHNVEKSKKQQDTNASRLSADEPTKQHPTQRANTVNVNASSVDAYGKDSSQYGDDDGPSESGSNDSGSDASDDEDDSDSGSSDDEDEYPVAPEEQFEVKFARDDGTEPPLRALIMAAATAFAIEKDPAVAIVVDGHRYKVRSDYLVQHCAFIRNSVVDGQPCPDITFDGRDPVIVRAFIQAITSSHCEPKHRLPEYDFDFEFAHNRDLHGWDHSDPVGVIGGDSDRVKARSIIWTVGACMLMYQIAMDFDCDLVRNLVVDKLRALYEEEQNLVKNHNKKVLKRPRIPLEILRELSSNTDGPLIRILGALHINRMWLSDSQLEWPNELSARGDLVDAMIDDWADSNEDDQEQYCHRSHHHAKGVACHISSNDQNLPTTENLISNLFSSPRNEAGKQCTEALQDFDVNDPDELRAINVIRLRGEMFQWTFRREEKVANVLLHLEKAREGSLEENPNDVDREYNERMLIKWTHYLKKIRAEHWDRWNRFEKDWMFSKKTEEAKKRAVDGENETSEPLPWDGD